MSCSLSKLNATSLTFYLLHHTCNDGQSNNASCAKEYNITAGVDFVLFVVCTVSVVLTCVKYNSVTVLNLRVRPTAISNVLWIIYFLILGIRSLILGIVYVDSGHILRIKTIPEVLYFTESFLKILEVLFLLWTLEYQRKHRSKGFIQDELERFNYDSIEQTRGLSCKKVVKTTYNIFTAQAVLCLVFLVVFGVFFVWKNKQSKAEYLYWTYNGCLWSLCISYIVLSIIIVAKRTTDEGPSKSTKVLLICGVVLTLPADIPFFIWQQCILQGSSVQVLNGYVISQTLLIIAVVLFMAVLIREFQRLKEEAHWNVIDQAESYYNISGSM